MSVATYYFNSYDDESGGEAWSDTPEAMVDGNEAVYTGWEATPNIVQLLTGNTFDGTGIGKIAKVELRINGYIAGGASSFQLRPNFNGVSGDTEHNAGTAFSGQWLPYVDITNDANAPTTWTWQDITNLTCDVRAEVAGGSLKASKVEIRVSYNEITFYFNSYDNASAGVEWETTPGYMVNNSLTSDAKTTINEDVQLLDTNTCDGTELLGDITKVELRIYGTRVHASNKVNLRPVFSGSDDGDLHDSLLFTEGWTTYVDITSDTNSPASWTWDDIKDLDLDVQSFVSTMWVLVAKVEIRVTFTAYKKTGNFFGNPF